jgi:hypothetical protein
MKKLILSSLMLLIMSNSKAQLTGEIRNNFKRAFDDSCYSSQRQASENISLSNADLQKFCGCSSEYIANQMSNSLVASIERGEQQFNPALRDLATKFCVKKVFKK